MVNYENCTLEELYDVKENINREKYPDRYQAVINAIKQKESANTINQVDTNFLEESKGFNSRSGCLKIIKYGVYTGIFYSGILFLWRLIEFLSEQIALNEFLYGFTDVVLLAFLTYFLYKKSRVASTLLLSYFLGSTLYTWFFLGKFGGIIVTAAMLLLLYAATHATYIWHARYEENDS